MKKKGLLSVSIIILLLVLGYATYKLSSPTASDTTLHIPVQKVSSDITLTPAPISTLQEYQLKREQTRQEDIRTLQSLIDGGAGTAAFLADAAEQLTQIVKAREAELAIEGTLMGNGFTPCLAVVAPGSITVMLDRDTLSRGEAALIMTMCESHSDVSLENIKIMTGDMF